MRKIHPTGTTSQYTSSLATEALQSLAEFKTVLFPNKGLQNRTALYNQRIITVRKFGQIEHPDNTHYIPC